MSGPGLTVHKFRWKYELDVANINTIWRVTCIFYNFRLDLLNTITITIEITTMMMMFKQMTMMVRTVIPPMRLMSILLLLRIMIMKRIMLFVCCCYE